VEDFDLGTGELHLYRAKVDLEQTHRLSNGCLAAVRAYTERDAPPSGSLWRGSDRSGRLTGTWSERAITRRVRDLGRRILGIPNLSAHDLRHTWATLAARNGTALDRLMDAGGWSSPAMPMRYVERARIANEGVKLE
jgi:integrase